MVVSGSHSTARVRLLRTAETLGWEEPQPSWQSSSKFPAALKRGLDAGDTVDASAVWTGPFVPCLRLPALSEFFLFL